MDVFEKPGSTELVTQAWKGFALPFLLPDELIAHILSFLVVMDPPKLNASARHNKTGKLGWVVVSHVCQRLRTIALACSELWGHLSLDEKDEVWNVFTERLKDSPLFLHGTTWRAYTPERISFILDRKHRLRELCLLSVPPDRLRFIVASLDGTLPQLSVLVLKSFRPTKRTVAHPHANFLSDIVPNLEELTLQGVVFPWGSGSLTLNKLEIASPGISQPFSTLADVAHTLCQLPALKTLVLNEALPESRLHVPNTAPVSLPSLETLSLADKTDSCWYLWSWLNSPALKTVYIDCTSNKDNNSLILNLLRVHINILPVMFSATQIHIPSQYSQMLSFRLDSALWPIKSAHNGDNVGCDGYKVTLKVLSDRPVDLARQLLIIVDDVTHLTIEDSFADDILFYEAFWPLREVIHLELNGPDTGVALSAMIPRSTNEEDILFPSLEILTCTNIDFERRLQHRGETTSGAFALDHAINARRHMNVDSLNEINLTNCNIWKTRVKDWRKVVNKVSWDEDEDEGF